MQPSNQHIQSSPPDNRRGHSFHNVVSGKRIKKPYCGYRDRHSITPSHLSNKSILIEVRMRILSTTARTNTKFSPLLQLVLVAALLLSLNGLVQAGKDRESEKDPDKNAPEDGGGDRDEYDGSTFEPSASPTPLETAGRVIGDGDGGDVGGGEEDVVGSGGGGSTSTGTGGDGEIPDWILQQQTVSLELPALEFDLSISEGNAVYVQDDLVEELVDAFLKNFFRTNAAQLLRSAKVFLETDVVSGGESEGQNRRDGGMLIRTTGRSDFVTTTTTSGEGDGTSAAAETASSPPPTREELIQVVETYFRFWGGRDLHVLLIEAGIPVGELSVSSDGVVISRTVYDFDAAANAEDDGKPTVTVVQGDSLAAGEREQQTRRNVRAVVISVVVIALFVAIGLGVWYMVCYRYRKSRGKSPAARAKSLEDSGMATATADEDDALSPSPRKSPRIREFFRGKDGDDASSPASNGSPSKNNNKNNRKQYRSRSIGSGGGDDDDVGSEHEMRSYSGMISLEDQSLFTSVGYGGNAGAASNPMLTDTAASALGDDDEYVYDTTRLDQVISSGKEGTKNDDGVHGDGGNNSADNNDDIDAGTGDEEGGILDP